MSSFGKGNEVQAPSIRENSKNKEEKQDFYNKKILKEDVKIEDDNGTVLKENQPVIEKIEMID